MPGCFVKGCSFSWRQKDPDITLHVFPRNPDLIKKWLLQIYQELENIDDFVAKIQGSNKGVYRICSRHFASSCYEMRMSGKALKKDAIPTIFPSVRPYSLEEDHAEHPYAKKRKLETPFPSELDDSLTSEGRGKMLLPPISANVATSQGISFSTTPFDIATQGGVDFPCSQHTLVRTLEDFHSTSSVRLEDLIDVGLLKAKRPYKPRARRTLGTNTDHYPGQSHKSTQFDKIWQTKNKCFQVFRRPPHRSIAIQCNLSSLPSLPQASGMLTKQNFKIAGIPFTSHDPRFSHLVDKPMSGAGRIEVGGQGLSDWYLSQKQNLSIDISPLPSLSVHSDMSPGRSEPEESASPEMGQPDESYSPNEGEEELYGNQNINMDPKDADISLIPMPECPENPDNVSDKKFIVFESCLNKLLFSCKCSGVQNCPGDIVKIKKYRIGSAVFVTASCSLQHRFHLWTSQPMIRKMPVGNLLISSGVLCSGSDFSKIDRFFQLMGIIGISKSTHDLNQNQYLFPTINHHWLQERTSFLQKVQDRPVALVGDCQRDSPGFSTEYCIYTFLDQQTKKIMDFQIERLDCPTSSLEKHAFQMALNRLIQDNVNVHVICTNRHTSVRKLLKEHYGHIKHQLDVWHVARTVGKRIFHASKKENCSQLAKWVATAKKHLWWSASTCERNPTLLREKWISLAHHIANRHYWDDATLYRSCNHKPLINEKRQWLKAGSRAHCKFRKIVLNKHLLKDLKYLSSFCNTEELEMFHSISREYHSKHHHYLIDEIMARSQLAALDHNKNINQIQASVSRNATFINKGTPWHHYTYNRGKKRCRGSVNQDFIKAIIADVLCVASGEKSFDWTSRHAKRRTMATSFQFKAREPQNYNLFPNFLQSQNQWIFV